MKKIISALAILLAIFGCSTTPVAPITATISSYGITSHENYSRVPLAQSPTGMQRLTKQLIIVKETDQIPIKIGASFGICAEFSGVSSSNLNTIQRFVVHPKMKNPEGKISTGLSYPATPKSEKNITSDCHGYGLDNEFELLPGIWTIGFQQDGKVIVSKEFQVK
jgi:hypothetical protein